jgi:hypothetical protein
MFFPDFPPNQKSRKNTPKENQNPPCVFAAFVFLEGEKVKLIRLDWIIDFNKKGLIETKNRKL